MGRKFASFIDDIGSGRDATTPGIDGEQIGKKHEERVNNDVKFNDKRDSVGRAASRYIVKADTKIGQEIIKKGTILDMVEVDNSLGRVAAGLRKDYILASSFPVENLTKLSSRDEETMKQASKYTRYASTDDQEEAIVVIEKWLKKLGRNIVGATTIGKSPQTVILDLTYQGGEIRINSCGFGLTERGYDGVKVYGEAIGSDDEFETFKNVIEENLGKKESSSKRYRVTANIKNAEGHIIKAGTALELVEVPEGSRVASNLILASEIPSDVIEPLRERRDYGTKVSRDEENMEVRASIDYRKEIIALLEETYGEVDVNFDELEGDPTDLGVEVNSDSYDDAEKTIKGNGFTLKMYDKFDDPVYTLAYSVKYNKKASVDEEEEYEVFADVDDEEDLLGDDYSDVEEMDDEIEEYEVEAEDQCDGDNFI